MVTFLLRSVIAVLSFCLIVLPVQAARDTDSYDGNIFALYAGNGSLDPLRSRWPNPRQQGAPASSFTTSMTAAQAKRSQVPSQNCSGCGETALTSCL